MAIFTRVDEGYISRYVRPTHYGGGGEREVVRVDSWAGVPMGEILVAERGPLEHIVHVLFLR